MTGSIPDQNGSSILDAIEQVKLEIYTDRQYRNSTRDASAAPPHDTSRNTYSERRLYILNME